MKRLAAKVLSSNWFRTTCEVRNMCSTICWLTGKPDANFSIADNTLQIPVSKALD